MSGSGESVRCPDCGGPLDDQGYHASEWADCPHADEHKGHYVDGGEYGDVWECDPDCPGDHTDFLGRDLLAGDSDGGPRG